MPIAFRFRWIPFVAATLLVLLGIALGQWQTRRAVEKETNEAKLLVREAAPLLVLDGRAGAIDDIEYRRVTVQGGFVRDWAVYLDNRPYQGVAGFYVLMPFKIAGSDTHILVQRGWTPRNPVDRARLQALSTPLGRIEVQGLIRRHPGKLLQLGHPAALRPNAIVQNLDLAEFAQASKLALQPFLLEQLSDTHDSLVRDWPRPSSGADRNRGYAFQWYGLAAMAALFFIVTGFRRGTK
jgi:cytochrome oxidase assembly protein ShyY1